MKVKELIKDLNNLSESDKNRKIVLHYYSNIKGSKFLNLEKSANPKVNSKNLFVLIKSRCRIKPIRD